MAGGSPGFRFFIFSEQIIINIKILNLIKIVERLSHSDVAAIFVVIHDELQQPEGVYVVLG